LPGPTPYEPTTGRRGEILPDLFARAVRRHRSRIAVRLADQDGGDPHGACLTYGQLDEKANQFARYLLGRHIGAGDRVAIRLPRGLDQYWCLLGILKIGAAYVPVDWNAPRARVAQVVSDCGARAIVTRGAGGPIAAGVELTVDLDRELATLARFASHPPPFSTPAAAPDDLAYIIYTSGSTGSPKGAMIRHRNICHLVRAESAILGLSASDRVFGAFSLAFDMSVETMWTGWFAGAEVICPSESLALAAGDIAAVLGRLSATVWHAAPTMLSMVEDDVPSVRLINLGGEACPPALVKRWRTPGRRMVNTYGPTETTVTATWAELTPGRPVTIGRPLPGYAAWIVDPAMQLVGAGEAGELLISGKGVGAGYVGQPELSADRFIAASFCRGDETGEIAYRTGDLCRLDGEGNIEYLGRIDTQVKIRGHRVELGEIESAILEDGAVAQAVVDLYRDERGDDWLIAFIVQRAGASFDLKRLCENLSARLPTYMRPQAYELRRALPTLPSGKVDRKTLTRSVGPRATRPIEPPGNLTEARLLNLWAAMFAPQKVSVLDNFFDDLGGHSLLAARMISLARAQPNMAAISIHDLYQAQTIRALAERLDEVGPGVGRVEASFRPVSHPRRSYCVAAQGLSAIMLFTFAGLQWILPYLAYFWIAPARGALVGLAAAAAAFVAMPPLMLMLSIVGKWAIIGRVKPGDYPLWGLYYFRWWLTRRLLALSPVRYLAGTPFLNIYLRLLGARVSRDAFVGAESMDTPDLISIGEGAIVSQGAVLATSRVEHGLLRLGTVDIGRRAFVGAMAVVGRGASIGDDASLDDLSALSPGAAIPAGEYWTGSPAGPESPRRAPDTGPAVAASRRLMVALGLLTAAMLLPLAEVLPIAPGLACVVAGDIGGWTYLAITPLLALSYVVNMCALTVAVKRLLLGRVRRGRYSIWSGFYIRYWFVERLNHLALDLLHPIFATLFVRPWYRLMGARVAARAEISSASTAAHDLIEFGEECFIADGVSFGAAHMEPGVLRLEATRVGRRAFVGNSALLPAGCEVGDDVLIGVMSRPPKEARESREAGATWFGSPALRLPNRPTSEAFEETLLFRPAKSLVATRLAIETVRVAAPLTVFLMLFEIVLAALTEIISRPDGVAWLVAAFPLIYTGFNIAAGAFVAAMKWLVVGRYEPMVAPHWSVFVWRTELVTSTYEALAATFLLEPLRGTPFINMYLRLLGCELGDRVYTDTTDITEFDLVKVGDDAALNQDCGLQTHLFEDRVMKLGRVSIGPRAVVGAHSIILYDAVLEAGARLGDLSVVMKDERLPADTAWSGAPARARAGPEGRVSVPSRACSRRRVR
jgi:non-ribosomal peptide synthetase-like protein